MCSFVFTPNNFLEFPIDKKSHAEERSKLEEMLSDEVSSTIKFTIVSEPLMEEMELKECIEVGYVTYFSTKKNYE